jgi:hypothetical protein
MTNGPMKKIKKLQSQAFFFFSTQEQKNNFTKTIHNKLSIKTCRVFVNVILLYDIVSRQGKSISPF